MIIRINLSIFPGAIPCLDDFPVENDEGKQRKREAQANMISELNLDPSQPVVDQMVQI